MLTTIQRLDHFSFPRCPHSKLIQDRTLALRHIVSQLAVDTGSLPISTCSRPDLENCQPNSPAVTSASEFTLLSKLTSAQSEAQPGRL